MKPGPKGKSIQEHLRDGTYREDRHGHRRVVEEINDHLTFDPFLAGDIEMTDKELMDHLAIHLHEAGYNHAADKHMLQQWAILYRAQADVYQWMNQEGYHSNYGKKQAISVFQEICKDIRTLLGEYHLTPRTRSQRIVEEVNAKKAAADDPVGDWLSN